MKKSLLLASVVVFVGAIGFSGASKADSQDELLRRLEAKVDALAKENASLRDRVKRVESAPRTAAASAAAANSKQAATPTPAGGLSQAALNANAAYIPVKAAPYRSGCANFAGWNVGLNGGLATHASTWNDLDNWIDNFGNDFNTSSVSKTRTGGTVGVSGGYTWQRGCTAYGVEIDGNWAFGLNGTTTASPAVGGTTLSIHDKVDWWATARGRGGIVVDDLMLYLTGGLAAARITHDWTVTDPAPATEAFSAHKTRWGGVVGVGAEWALNDKFSVRTEVLYLHFLEDNTSGFSTAGGQTVNFKTQDSMLVSRLAGVYRW